MASWNERTKVSTKMKVYSIIILLAIFGAYILGLLSDWGII